MIKVASSAMGCYPQLDGYTSSIGEGKFPTCSVSFHPGCSQTGLSTVLEWSSCTFAPSHQGVRTVWESYGGQAGLGAKRGGCLSQIDSLEKSQSRLVRHFLINGLFRTSVKGWGWRVPKLGVRRSLDRNRETENTVDMGWG